MSGTPTTIFTCTCTSGEPRDLDLIGEIASSFSSVRQEESVHHLKKGACCCSDAITCCDNCPCSGKERGGDLHPVLQAAPKWYRLLSSPRGERLLRGVSVVATEFHFFHSQKFFFCSTCLRASSVMFDHHPMVLMYIRVDVKVSVTRGCFGLVLMSEHHYFRS